MILLLTSGPFRLGPLRHFQFVLPFATDRLSGLSRKAFYAPLLAYAVLGRSAHAGVIACTPSDPLPSDSVRGGRA